MKDIIGLFDTGKRTVKLIRLLLAHEFFVLRFGKPIFHIKCLTRIGCSDVVDASMRDE